MPRFLIDENLPRSLAPSLRAEGFDAQDVRDLGLRGAPDSTIFQAASSRGLVLITEDLGFGSMLRAFPASLGVVLIRVPNEWPASSINKLIVKSLPDLTAALLPGTLVVIAPERIRIRTFRQP